MWLSDFEEAIAAVKEHCSWECFSKIEVGAFGEKFVFTPNGRNDFYFMYMRHSKRIYKCYSDTWRNPEHYEIIYEGDKK